MALSHSYEVDINWINGRYGRLSSPDLAQQMDVATPPQFPGGMEHIWSPEHLFTAAVNSCLMTTFLAIAESSKLQFSKFGSQAYGKLELIDNRFVMSEITLVPTLTIFKGEDREKAMRVLEKSKRACLISNSITSEIVFKPEIVVAA